VWFHETTSGVVTVDSDRVLARPYGWVFFGTPALTGGACILVDRLNGHVQAIGSGTPLEFALALYESTLNDFVLSMAPELPPGATSVVPGDFGPIHADRRIDPGTWPEVVRAYFEAQASRRAG